MRPTPCIVVHGWLLAALGACASAVTPDDGASSLEPDSGSPTPVDGSTPLACSNGAPTSVHVADGAAGFARCPDLTVSSPDPARAPRIRGFTVRTPCGCGTGQLAFDLDVSDPDTPVAALRSCVDFTGCAGPDAQGAAMGTSFWMQCPPDGPGAGSWTIAVVDPQGNHDEVSGLARTPDGDLLGCVDGSFDCTRSSPSGLADGSRGCF